MSDPSQRICLVTFILAESVYYVIMWYPATVTDAVTECVESSAKRLILGPRVIAQVDTMFQNSALQSPSVFSRVRLKGSGYRTVAVHSRLGSSQSFVTSSKH